MVQKLKWGSEWEFQGRNAIWFGRKARTRPYFRGRRVIENGEAVSEHGDKCEIRAAANAMRVAHVWTMPTPLWLEARDGNT